MLCLYYNYSKKDIQKIQARFGEAVASIFLFYRWLLLLFTIVGFILIIFALYHLFSLIDRGKKLENIYTGNGLLPGLMLYSNYDPSEGSNYAFMIIITNLTIIFISCTKIIKEDKTKKEIKAIEGVGFKSSYAREFLSIWDNSLSSKREMEDFSGSVVNSIIQKLEDTKTAGIKKEITRNQLIILYLKRALGFLLFLAVQVI